MRAGFHVLAKGHMAVRDDPADGASQRIEVRGLIAFRRLDPAHGLEGRARHFHLAPGLQQAAFGDGLGGEEPLGSRRLPLRMPHPHLHARKRVVQAGGGDESERLSFGDGVAGGRGGTLYEHQPRHRRGNVREPVGGRDDLSRRPNRARNAALIGDRYRKRHRPLLLLQQRDQPRGRGLLVR